MTSRHKTPQRGGGLFGDTAPELAKATSAAYRINIDGGSRGNPGPASYGVVVRDARGEIVAKLKKYIGRATNNVAEYFGLIAALDYALDQHIRAVRIESDSQLLVMQMRGRYKVKSADLQPLFERARKMAHTFESFKIEHVYREKNAEADALANEALDEVSGAPPKTEKSEAKPETLKLRARLRGGVLYPLQDVDLPDGTEVDLLLKPRPKS